MPAIPGRAASRWRLGKARQRARAHPCVTRFCRHASRRASSATSRPILFRYLKQSATVRAMPVTRIATPSTTWVSMPDIQRVAREAHHPQRGPIQPWNPILGSDRNPDLERCLGGQLVEAQCGQQAKPRFRDALGYDPNAFIDIPTRHVWCRVEATRQADQHAGCDETGELRAGNAGLYQFTRARRTLGADQCLRGGCPVVHVHSVP